MAGGDLGEGTRLAAATGAWICFEDEAGQTLRARRRPAPGARRGRTPVISVSGKGSSRVSVAGLACLKADAPGRLFYRTRIHRGRRGERRSMSEADYADPIAAAHRTLAAPVILICNQTLVPHVDKQSSTERGDSGYSNEVPASDLRGARVRGNVATRPDRPPGCERDGWPANTLARLSPEWHRP